MVDFSTWVVMAPPSSRRARVARREHRGGPAGPTRVGPAARPLDARPELAGLRPQDLVLAQPLAALGDVLALLGLRHAQLERAGPHRHHELTALLDDVAVQLTPLLAVADD